MMEVSMRRFILLAAVFACLAPSIRAEDIVLIDGRYLHVKVLTPSDRGIQVQLLDTGGQVFIPWGLIIENDRKRLMRDFGLGEKEEQVIVEDGHKLTTKAGDTYEGRILSETADNVELKHRGSTMNIPKSSIRETEKLSVNVLEIYSAEEYFNKRAGELKVPDDDIPGNMELAELAYTLNLFEKSYLHYTKVQAVDAGYQTTFIDNRKKLLEELQKNKQIRDLLVDAQRNMAHRQWVKSAKQLEDILALKDLPAPLRAEADVLKGRWAKLRYEHFRREVRNQYELTLKNKIRSMSRDDKLKFEEARRKLRADLHKEVVADLATRLQLDGREVEKMWEERGFHQPRIASYGSGSFIVLGRAPNADKFDAEMQKYMQQLLRTQQQSQGRNNQNASLSAQPDKLPKPPTKEEWWTKVSTSQDRESWMLAFWAENAKKVIVVGDRWEDCGRCGGTGALKFSGSQGDIMRSTCPTCQGHQRFKLVAYK
jgi:hypothetical protein